VPEVFLVRHAPTSWSGRRYCGLADPALSRHGHQVARRLAGELAAIAPDHSRIVSSPARRAIQTASQIAAAVRGMSMEVDPRWSETDVGSAEGLTFDQLSLRLPDLARRLAGGDPDIDWPDGESASDLATRVAAAWIAICEQATPTIVVSHAGPLRVALALAMNVPIPDVGFLETGRFVVLAGRCEPRSATGPHATIPA
jgi:broad specificity phosphatase PhoE